MTALLVSFAMVLGVHGNVPTNEPNGNAYGHPRYEVSCTPGPQPWCRLVLVRGR